MACMILRCGLVPFEVILKKIDAAAKCDVEII
jgi:hypothetical protein